MSDENLVAQMIVGQIHAKGNYDAGYRDGYAAGLRAAREEAVCCEPGHTITTPPPDERTTKARLQYCPMCLDAALAAREASDG